MKRYMKMLSALTAVLMILSVAGADGLWSMAPVNVAAAEESEGYEYFFRTIGDQKYIAPSDRFTGGDGTKENPYQISDAAELAYLSELVNSGDYTYQSACYILTDDIVLNENPNGGDWSKTAPEYAWKPIGVEHNFCGTFDGDKHTISGMYINEDVSKYDDYNSSYGLFGDNGGTIKNLSIIESYICVSGYTSNIGAVAGHNSSNASCIDCTAEADIYCYDADCGGITGENNGTIRGCSFSGNVNSAQKQNYNNIGGIAGSNSGTVSFCKNNGSILGNSERAGGITGVHYEGKIEESVNDGNIIGSGSHVGGIAGTAFLSAGGGVYQSVSCDIINCINNGTVKTTEAVAGGVAGNVTNSHSKYTLTISGCENNGVVESAKKTGGIAGAVTLLGAVSLSGCRNTVDLSSETAGGIIAEANYNFGCLSVTDSANSGNVSADMYAAGIIAENYVLGMYLEKKGPLDIVITGCENTGSISTNMAGGGVLGVITAGILVSGAKRITLTLKNDRNRGDLFCNSTNDFVGGIAGNLGIPYASTMINDCTAEGTISFADIPADEDTLKLTQGRLELTRMGGGIVGRIGTGLYLSTIGDKKSEMAVNGRNANIQLERCSSTMYMNAPDESKYCYEVDGRPVFLNRFGGIVGYFSGQEGYVFSVTDCMYANTDRGLGDPELPDIGTRM